MNNISESNVVVINMLLYIALSIYCILKYKWHNLSSLLSILYSICAICGCLLFFFPLYDLTYSSNGTCTIDGCLYLFFCNFLLIMSLCRINIDECRQITSYDGRILKRITIFLCVVFTIKLLFDLPESIRFFFSGRDLADMRSELYGTNSSGSFFLIGLITRMFGSAQILLLAISSLRLLVIKDFSSWDKYALVLYFALKLNVVLSVVSRGIVVFSMLELIVVFCLFHSYFTAHFKRIVVKYGLIIVPVAYMTFSAITYARFGSSDEQSMNLATLRYAGESNLNFMALAYPDLNEPFHGYIQFSLYRRVLGMDYDDGLLRDGADVFNTYIQQHYHYNNPIYIFHGLVGTFYMNWGKWLTLLICAVIYLTLRRQRNSRSFSTMSIIMAIFWGAFIGKGIFFGDYGSESGNLFFIYLIILYFYLSKHGHTVQLYNKKL